MPGRESAQDLLAQLLGGRARERPRRSRGATVAGLGISVAAGLGVASWLQGRKPVPSLAGRIRLAGLGAPVEVYRDRWGIPAIFARDEHDLFLAQGAVQAADRLFQMDLFRRVGTGRLAEVIGEAGLDSDRLMRTLGFGESAAAELELASPAAREVLASFTRGVNAWIQHAEGRLPFEFGVLGYEPEPWAPSDSLVFAKLMALGLCGNWEAELVRLEIAERFGVETLQVLDDDETAVTFPSQLDPEVLARLSEAARTATSTMGMGAGTGSNNWVIAGSRTESGGAILCNDPHLDLSMPALWHECVLRCPTFEVRGFAAPGSPGVVVGHNGRISWGLTNSCADVQDLYVETIDDERGTYLDTDGVGRLEVVEQEVQVRDADPVSFSFRRTRRGPVISDAVGLKLAHPLSLRWDSGGPGRMLDAVLQMNRAQDRDGFLEACRHWSAPGMNIVYADADGQIGFQMTGDIPVRAAGDGRIPSDATNPDAEWVSTIPFEEMPSSWDPPAGTIVTANDRVVPDDYPHFISREWMNGYRGIRIRTLLDRAERHDAAGQAAIQADVLSLPARELVPALRDLGPVPRTRDGQRVLGVLSSWDHRLTAGSEAAEAYRLVLWALQEQAFGYLDDLLAAWLGKSRMRVTGFWSLLARTTPRIIRDMAAGDTALLDHAWGIYASGRGMDADLEPPREGAPEPGTGHVGPPRDDAGGWVPVRTWPEAAERALDTAGRQLYGNVGDHRHRMRLQHPLGVLPGLGGLLNRGPWPSPGDTDTVWQASRFASDSNDASMVGPSMRMIVDMGDLDASLAVLAGGQSGHPSSPHYADQLPMWRQGRVRPAPWTPSVLIDSARYRQHLEPA